MLLLLLVGGGAMALLGSDGEEIKLTPGVYSEVPDGWTVPQEVNSPAGQTLLVPVAQRGTQDPGTLVVEGSAHMYFTDGSFLCELETSGVTSDSMPFTSGYEEVIMASGLLADGEGTVAGHPAKWTLAYGATARPWVSPDSPPLTASEYPDYAANVALNVCVEELDLNARFDVGSAPFRTTGEGVGEQPTATDNASVSSTREEVRQDLRQKYEANIEAMIMLLEEVDIEGLFNDGSTDLSAIPTILDGDEELSDPFEGELAEAGNAPEEPEISEAEVPTSEEEQFEEFARVYYEASSSGDWESTYSMLYETSQSGVTDSQDEFTEEEWVEIHQAIRDAEGPLPPLESITVELPEGESHPPATITFSYEDGTERTMTAIIPTAVNSGDETGPQRYLTEEEISELSQYLTSGSTAPFGDDFVAEAEEAAEEYYQAAGMADWEYTYEHLDSETQSMFTREEWSQKNQYYWNLNSISYDVLAVEMVDNTEETIAEVVVRVTGEDGSSFVRTTYWVLEDGEWLHRFGQEEIDLFMPDLSYEEFLETQQ